MSIFSVFNGDEYLQKDCADDDDSISNFMVMVIDYEGEYIGDIKSEGNNMSPVIDMMLVLNEEKTNMDIEDGASEQNMATERKKKEKRKTKEHGVEPEQKYGFETAIEVKKNKNSIC
ncbi:hypothetical protein MKX01_017251 [Papaver californicum]|nr:hypothetical protein MKX01_017251 [Papaver californicum]